MNLRFPAFVLFLLISLGMVAYGIFGNRTKLYENPSPEDLAKGLGVNEKSAFTVSEVRMTDWISKERVVYDTGFSCLIDTAREAICYS